MFVYFVIDFEVLIRSCEKGVFFLGDFIVEGYFIFDIFTLSKMKFFHKTTLKDNLAFAKYKWKMKVKNNVLYHNITIIDNKEKINEQYHEYYYDYKQLLDDRFEVVKVVTDFSETLDLENGERILVVLKK